MHAGAGGRVPDTGAREVITKTRKLQTLVLLGLGFAVARSLRRAYGGRLGPTEGPRGFLAFFGHALGDLRDTGRRVANALVPPLPERGNSRPWAQGRAIGGDDNPGMNRPLASAIGSDEIPNMEEPVEYPLAADDDLITMADVDLGEVAGEAERARDVEEIPEPEISAYHVEIYERVEARYAASSDDEHGDLAGDAQWPEEDEAGSSYGSNREVLEAASSDDEHQDLAGEPLTTSPERRRAHDDEPQR